MQASVQFTCWNQKAAGWQPTGSAFSACGALHVEVEVQLQMRNTSQWYGARFSGRSGQRPAVCGFMLMWLSSEAEINNEKGDNEGGGDEGVSEWS